VVWTVTLDPEDSTRVGAHVGGGRRLGLLLLWSVDEPERSGEVALVPSVSRKAQLELGRAEGGPLQLDWVRQRPGINELTGPLRSPRISRVQLQVRQPDDERLEISNVGRCPMLVGGCPIEQVTLGPGAVLELRKVVALMVVSRPATLPACPEWPSARHTFGAADPFGIVGESPEAWALRGQIAFIAGRPAHALIRGASGTGKELVAQAIHALSPRRARPLIARNAATFPETLVDAELFGNAKSYPNVGAPERPGLVGEADGSTLFLDEFGELPQAVQAHLLRVLDAGEYSRLGEAKPRRADLRLIAATNRPESAIKEDVLARLRLRLEVPGLPQRREDVPLIAAHLLRRIARQDPVIARRYFPEGDPERTPRISPRLMAALSLHPFATHVRELEALLWRVMSEETGDEALDLPSWLAAAPATAPGAEPEPGPAGEEAVGGVDPLSLSPEQIQAALDAHGGRQEPAWRELGLSSRHVLTRLVKRYGLRVRGRGD
jgi:two-component system nitrogen regulation response regulator GlnG/two-component system response regulator HydG